jgi:hypothetical protein
MLAPKPTPMDGLWTEPQLGATGSLTKPSDFELGSVESRAAAKALLSVMKDSQFDGPVLELDFASSHFDVSREEHVLDWVDEPDRYVKYETPQCAIRSIILETDIETLTRIIKEKYGNSPPPRQQT